MTARTNSREVPLSLAYPVLLFVGAGAASGIYADPLANYYGNTLIGTANGATARASLARDGAFVGTSPQGTSVKGRWSSASGELCFTVTEPAPPRSQPVCIPLAAHKVGDKWTVNAGQRTWSVTLQPGS